MTKPVVVGLDGSRESLAAADWGARAALHRDLLLRLIHAWEGAPGLGTAEILQHGRCVPQYWARRTLRGALEVITERYPQVYVSAEQVHKPPREALLSEAASAELLVLGNAGLSGVGSLLTGSVALTIISHATVPVVLVRAGWSAAADRSPEGGPTSLRTPYRDTVVAVDPSRSCDGLLAFAFDEAARRGTALHAVHIWHLPYSTSNTPASSVHSRAQDAAVAALDEQLQPWRDKYPVVPVHATAVHARSAHEIVHAARDAGLLVVGRRPRRIGLGPHTGPVTHTVIHHVGCPVAVVPHD
ncbi:universal stress protein [Streptomyces longispororuber]|uniref:universal stress protein n=1 Tax=Streptomyces longispororuber TaxID=68230 RepID=UPI00210E7A07|nr:universal stress protein [Streptomyces longispororuber]MCQ4205655.1 universal stress protein [Streptomyces longispororuber]